MSLPMNLKSRYSPSSREQTCPPYRLWSSSKLQFVLTMVLRFSQSLVFMSW